VAQALIREAGVPIAAPSANRFSRPSPTNAAHVLADLDGRVDVVLNAGRTAIGVESTILDLTAPTPVVLRPGGVSLEDLREHLPGLAFRPPYVAEGTTAPAPGTLEKHYSPNARVMVFKGDRALEAMRDTVDQYIMDGQRVGIMLRDQDAAYFGGLAAQIVLMGSNDEEMALQLFAGLRTLDASEVDVILVQAPTREGIGLALYDRLLRAAEGQIIEVGQA
jgi:L-threonylcarbamoyladenylate synthase